MLAGVLGETYTEYNADWPGETDVVTLGLRCFEGSDGSKNRKTSIADCQIT